MRAGTYIVVQHRGSIIDLERGDGYIEIGAENNTHFDKYYDNVPPSEWSDRALNVNAATDIMQIRRPNGQNEHAMGHSDNSYPDFNAITGAKLGYNSRINANSAVGADAGQVSDYSRGSLTGTEERTGGNIIKGKPTNDKNMRFIRNLRQPTWTNPNLSVSGNNGSIRLQWNSAQNDLDNTQGYIVLRAIQGQTMGVPEDGKIYTVGQSIGQASVLAVLNSSATLFQHPISEVNCENNYQYAVYAFRFGKDDETNDDIVSPLNARGRSYNETEVASALLELELPQKPDFTEGDRVIEFCSGDEATIVISNVSAGTKYSWYAGNQSNRIAGESGNELTVNVPGKYFARAESTNGCFVFSEEFTVNEVAIANINIAFVGPPQVTINNDTILSICSGESIELRAFSAGLVEWFKNGVSVSNSPLYTISESGEYYAVNDQGACVDTSYNVTVRVPIATLDFTENELDFGTITVSSSNDLTLLNTGNSEITVTQDMVTFNRTDVTFTPALPWVVPASSNLVVQAEWIPTVNNNINEQLIIDKGCGEEIEILLKGQKASGALSSSPLAIVDSIKVCGLLEPIRFEIELENSGDTPLDFNPIEADRVNVSTGVSIIEYPPRSLDVGGKSIFEFTYLPNNNIQTDDIIEIYFANQGSSVFDTLSIPFRVAVEHYAFRASVTQATLPRVGECDSEVRFTLEYLNAGFSAPDIIVGDNSSRLEIVDFDNIDLNAATSTIDFVLRNPNEETVTVNLYDKNCDDTISVDVIIEKEGYSYEFSEFDNSEILLCDRGETVSKIVDLTVSGSGSEQIILTDISGLPFGFTANLSSGDNLSTGTQNLILTNNNAEPGDYKGVLVFVLNPCNRRFEVEYDFSIEVLSLDISENTIDFSESVLNVVSSKQIVLTNPISQPIDVGLIGFDTKGGVLEYALLSGRTLPIALNPNEQEVIEFSYNPDEYGRDDSQSLNLEIGFSSNMPQCSNLEELTITATSESKNDINIKIIPGIAESTNEQDESIIPGTEIEIPLSFETEEYEYLVQSGMKSWEFIVDLDNTLFYETGIRISQPNAFDNGYVYTTTSNELKVLINIIDIEEIRDGEFVRLIGTATLGDDLKTDILIDENSFKSFDNKAFEINLESGQGLLQLDSTCDISYRGVTSYNELNASVKDINGTNFTLVLEKMSLGVADIEVINSAGMLIDKKSETITGIQELYYHSFPSGAYFVRVSDGIKEDILPVYLK
ncbi:MAG: hypothetical protein Kapaf2KO_22380 [Candidatus Kapaibacteriales bacterium]